MIKLKDYDIFNLFNKIPMNIDEKKYNIILNNLKKI